MNAQFDGSSQADPRGAQHQTVQPQPTVPRPPGLTPGCATRAPRHTLLPVRLLHSLVSATLRVHTARRCPCSEWRGAHACACVVWAADRAQVPGGLVSALSSPEPPTRGSSPQALTVRLSVQPGAQRRDGARWPCSRDTSPPCRHHAARALTLPASPAGGTAGASSDPRVACDRSRVLLHADERPGSTVPGKVGSACPAPHCCPHAPPPVPPVTPPVFLSRPRRAWPSQRRPLWSATTRRAMLPRPSPAGRQMPSSEPPRRTCSP